MKYPVNFEIGFRENTYSGKLIALEGNEGSGKTTQAKLLVERLTSEGKKAIYTKEPTDGEIGKFIRRILSGDFKVPPAALQYLFCADRVVHQEEFEEKIKDGYIVVTDRYFWSAVAYGIADMGGVADYYLTAFSVLSFYNQFMKPDYTFFLDVSLEEAKKRISKSEKHIEIYDKSENLEKIEKSYKNLIKQFPEEFISINANGTVEDVAGEIAAKLNI